MTDHVSTGSESAESKRTAAKFATTLPRPAGRQPRPELDPWTWSDSGLIGIALRIRRLGVRIPPSALGDHRARRPLSDDGQCP